MRINKYLASSGVCSRRQADRLIEEGRVRVNGTVAQNGMQAEAGDTVTVDGREVSMAGKKPVVLLFHKPRGLVCTEKAQGDQQTVIDYIVYPTRIFTVGRLDKDSEGLLLLTDQGDLANALMAGRYGHEKEYRVTADRPLTEEFLRAMASGVRLEELDVTTRPCRVKRLDDLTFSIVLTQGLNRQIRRMCAAFGYEVRRLRRVRIAHLTLSGIAPGKWREATEEELDGLYRLTGLKRTEPAAEAGAE